MLYTELFSLCIFLALAAFASTETGSLFATDEMADASEALQAIFNALHRAARPPSGGGFPPRGAAASTTNKSSSALPAGNDTTTNPPRAGRFLDEECGYRSFVHDVFGLDVEERVDCGACGRTTRRLRYTKFLHLVPVASLNLALEHVDGVGTMARAMRYVDGEGDARRCDADAGGCGGMNFVRHGLEGLGGGRGSLGGSAGGSVGSLGVPSSLAGADVDGFETQRAGKKAQRRRAREREKAASDANDAARDDTSRRRLPAVFCAALTWDTASADRTKVAETVRNVSPVIDLAEAYDRPEGAGDRESDDASEAGRGGGASSRYALACVVCYYGEHYYAFANRGRGDRDAADETDGWTLFDDQNARRVGAWGDVQAACEKGRMQPCVLFYQREG